MTISVWAYLFPDSGKASFVKFKCKALQNNMYTDISPLTCSASYLEIYTGYGFYY